jgi:hypothetical protein
MIPLRGAYREKGGSFTLLLSWRARGEQWRWEWKQRMRAARAPPSMEGSRRLLLPFICGVHTCLEEGAHLVGMSYNWKFAVWFVLLES